MILQLCSFTVPWRARLFALSMLGWKLICIAVIGGGPPVTPHYFLDPLTKLNQDL